MFPVAAVDMLMSGTKLLLQAQICNNCACPVKVNCVERQQRYDLSLSCNLIDCYGFTACISLQQAVQTSVNLCLVHVVRYYDAALVDQQQRIQTMRHQSSKLLEAATPKQACSIQ